MSQTDRTPRVALVTGASRRIGKCVAVDLARDGWRLVVHYGSHAEEAEGVRAEIVAAGGHAITVGGDLADSQTVERLFDACTRAMGPVTCLVNNASLFIEDSIDRLDPVVWDRQFAVNLRAPVLLAKAFAERLPPELEGNIVNIVDQRVLAPTPDFFSYSLSKAGLLTATRMLAQALAPRIRVNGIGPGPVLRSVYQDDASFAAEVDSTLLRRATTPSEIAAAVRFILDAPSLTGQMLALDAGQHLVWRASE
ncbi:MAG: SDR family oxidoreductase [Hyphomicrobiaceae bacterium]